jgi:hypothetical protein
MMRMNHQDPIRQILTIGFGQRDRKQVGVHQWPIHVIVTESRVQATHLECGGFSAPHLIGTITYRLRNGQATSDRNAGRHAAEERLYEAAGLLTSYSTTTQAINPLQPTNFNQPTLSYVPRCLPHSSKSTLPRTTRFLETTPPQPCQRRPSKRPTAVLQMLLLLRHITMAAAGYVCWLRD